MPDPTPETPDTPERAALRELVEAMMIIARCIHADVVGLDNRDKILKCVRRAEALLAQRGEGK